jgi:hypothetical protein
MNRTETISAGQGPVSTAQEEVLNLKKTMKAIAVLPGRPNTIHLREVSKLSFRFRRRQIYFRCEPCEI